MADCSKTGGLARSRLNYRCHVCAFFHSREDEYKILIPFMREGLDAGDRAVQIGPTCHDRCVTRDCADGEQRGSGITRIWAKMGWALGDFPGVHDIVEYESRLNYVLPKYDIAAVCTYDLTQFGASCRNGHLANTSQVIVGKVLQENPFYVPPTNFWRSCAAATPRWPRWPMLSKAGVAPPSSKAFGNARDRSLCGPAGTAALYS
jgi:hypothetical protein